MKTYTDKWGRFHDKPTDGVKSSSNNGWIYTAYALALGIDIKASIIDCYGQCKVSEHPLIMNRTPNDPEPPMSRDEIIGLVSLRLLPGERLEKNHWQYYSEPNVKPRKKLNWWKIAKALWKLKGKHRNYVWEEKIVDAYPAVFRLPPPDAYYVRKKWKMKTTRTQAIIFRASALQTLLKRSNSTGNISAKNIIWLQLKDMGMEKSFLYRLTKQKSDFKKYFKPEHIFNQGN